MASVTKRTTKKGVRYDVRYRDDDGRQRRESFTKKDPADKRAAEVETDKARGVYLDPAAGEITFRAFYDEWREAQVWSPSSRENIELRFRLHVLPTLGKKRLRDVRPLAVQKLVADLTAKGLAPSTVSVILGHVQQVFRAAMLDGRLPTNPAIGAKARKATRPKVEPWTHAQVAAMDVELPERFRVLVEIGASLGLRIGEAAALGPDNVDFLRRRVTIDRQVGLRHGRRVFALPKGGRTRTIPLPESLSFALAGHLRHFDAVDIELPWDDLGGEPRSYPLFVTTETGEALSASGFSAVWANARRRAGIADERKNGFHALRHYFASSLLHNGGDIVALSTYLGHASAAFTLNVYSHLMPSADDRMREAMDKAAAERCGLVSATG